MFTLTEDSNIEKTKLGLVARAYNFSPQEAEAGGLRIQVQPGLNSEFKTSLVTQATSKTMSLE
jgi:hypothetical protein